MKIRSILILVSFSAYVSLLDAKSISEKMPYPAACIEAVNNEDAFSQFKRHPDYREVLEHVSYEQGLEYLKIIREKYPEVLYYCDQFRQNDLLGNPHTYDYEDIGHFSPTTLRYMKVAGELKQMLGDKLKQMHIVEIGGGYGGQCKILSDLCGFASYTIVDLEACVALSKKYLNRLGINNVSFIANTAFAQTGPYDLVISNYAFSELDGDEQAEYLDKIICNTPYGYMTMNFLEPSGNRFSIEDLISYFCQHDRKGIAQAETPLTYHSNLLLTWKPIAEPHPSALLNKVRLALGQALTNNKKAITYTFSGGRFGDNLIAYFHAKWAALEYGLPLLYKPFPLADFLQLSEMDPPVDVNLKFDHVIKIQTKSQIPISPPSSLLVIPFFPEGKLEFEQPQWGDNLHFPIDWEDPIFHEEMIQCLAPKEPVKTLELPEKCITVALHLRRGDANEDFEHHWRLFPLKFPPDSYYIEQIERISKIFMDQKIYIHIFSDSPAINLLAESYSKAIMDPRITFGWDSDQKFEHNTQKLFHDFYSIPKFDCIIGCESNFSFIPAMLGDYKVKIMPTHFILQGNQHFIDQVEIKFNMK